jgi:D,D-heptose 1,7-bisphosphate phosphatase
MNMNKAIFLDKDGTLIEDISYNTDPDKIRLSPGVAEGLKLLQQKGYLLIIVTNQSGIARGYFSEEQFEKAIERLQELLADKGVIIDDIYHCPHHPEGVVPKFQVNCTCRKPYPGLLYQAQQEHTIDLSQSWMIGDILNDVEAGNSAGCKTILLDSGNETEWILDPKRLPYKIAADFMEAVQTIMEEENQDVTGEHIYG